MDKWAAPSKNFRHMRTAKARSACASAQADQSLCCPLKESLDTIEVINEEQMHGWNFVPAQDELESVHFAHAQTHFCMDGPNKVHYPNSPLTVIFEIMNYCIYPKYWYNLYTYHTYPKILNSPLYYLVMCLKYCCMFGIQCRPRSDATFCSVWCWSILFAKAYLSQYLGLLWYYLFQDK